MTYTVTGVVVQGVLCAAALVVIAIIIIRKR